MLKSLTRTVAGSFFLSIILAAMMGLLVVTLRWSHQGRAKLKSRLRKGKPEIIISLVFITIVGGLSLSFLGKKILKLIDDLFKRIPLLRTIYSAISQMTETFSKKDDDKNSVVLVEFPRIFN